MGSCGEATGLADEIRGFLRALDARGYEPVARPFLKPRHQVQLSANDQQVISTALKREPTVPCLVVHHYITNPQQVHIDGAVNVARVMFETDRMPATWLELLLQRDQIWVPCEHNAEAFRRGGIPASKIRVLGETIDFDLFAPGAEPYDLGLEDERFTFLSNFDFGERKGWRQLIAGWAKAFTADDDVRLVLKTGSYTHGEEYAAHRIRAFVREHLGVNAEKRMAPIEIVSARLPADQLPNLYAAADAYVLASRGEGWGRPYMEAMAMGLPTIGSRWSGNLDFMNDGNSWLVDGELVPVPEDAELYPTRITRGHNWFEPDIDSLAEALCDVARNRDACAAKAAGARAELMGKFGPEPIVERIVELATDAYGRAMRPYTCAIRGTFGSNASLAVVNDGIAGALDERGQNVIFRDTYSEMLINELPGVTHSWPPIFDAVTMGPTVMVLPWEYGSPPKEWVDGVCSRVDRVWVPSAYVRDCYIEGGMPPGVVEVVPNGVDLERFTPEGPSFELPSRAGCTFLFVGGSIWRKGVDVLLAAWAEAFGPDDDVQLVIKDFGTKTHYKSQHAGDQVAELMERDDVAPAVYLTDDLTPDELASLYRACDVFVTPYRGEGFCLPALEAMASGLPVIHTGTGPTSEFVPEDGGWKIPAQRELLREDVKLPEMVARGFIHEPDKRALVETLRSVAAAPDERRARGAAAHLRAQDYHWHKITAIAEKSLATLAAEGLPLAREIGTAELERRDELVLYSPDWTREDHWGPTLERWAAAVGQHDPVTLALHLPEGDPSALAGRILAHLEAAGHSEDELPDIALCELESASIASLVAAADAVLIHPDEGKSPELCRRARRLVHATPEGLLDYAASIRAGDEVAQAAATS